MTEEKKVETDEELKVIVSNISAVLAVASSVEGTLGPKGLDTLLVDRFGDVLVTNSGVTILERMEISHPAARMLLQVAKAQHAHVGDGTTTATVMAGAILKEGLNQISRGVPVSRLLEGIRKGVALAVEIMNHECAIPVKGLSDPALTRVAVIAGRGDEEMGSLIAQAASATGEESLRCSSFRFANRVSAIEGVADRLVDGVVLRKGRVSAMMPMKVSPATILVLEDSLVPEEVDEDALRTESGFKKSLELRNEFFQNLEKILSYGVNVIFCSGGIDSEAEEILSHSGVLAVRRLTGSELLDVAGCSGAKSLKRSGLRRGMSERMVACLGKAGEVSMSGADDLILVTGGGGKPYATLLVGAGTKHVTEEKERKAKDAASAFQAAFQSGVVAGGGACELFLTQELQAKRGEFKSMTSYGLDCVVHGLKQPFLRMAANAGFNPLEKAEEILSAMSSLKKNSLSLDFETGEVKDMATEGIYDPLAVKIHAIKSASEVAEAILRINRIIKMRENGGIPHAEKA